MSTIESPGYTKLPRNYQHVGGVTCISEFHVDHFPTPLPLLPHNSQGSSFSTLTIFLSQSILNLDLLLLLFNSSSLVRIVWHPIRPPGSCSDVASRQLKSAVMLLPGGVHIVQRNVHDTNGTVAHPDRTRQPDPAKRTRCR